MDNAPSIKFLPINEAYKLRWDENPKEHDIGSIAESISRHGLVELPKFDATLGSIVAGNGRIEALVMMHRTNHEPPRGIVVDDDGTWLVPVLYGVDATSADEAIAYAIDSNNLVLAGGDFTPLQAAKMWKTGIYEVKLIELALRGVSPVSVRADDLDALIRLRERQDDEAAANNKQIVGKIYYIGKIMVEVVTISDLLTIIRTGAGEKRIIITNSVLQEVEKTGIKAREAHAKT